MAPARVAATSDVEATQTDAVRAAEERRLFLRMRRFGDRGARDHLVERFLPLAAQLARRYRNTSQSFEDLLQVAKATHMDHEAVLESLEAADAFQAASLDAPARAAEPDDAAALLSSVPVYDQRFELVEYASVVRGTMAALPERDREAIRLRFGEDLTQDEIAERLGISQMQVSRLLRRALERLRTVAEAASP